MTGKQKRTQAPETRFSVHLPDPYEERPAPLPELEPFDIIELEGLDANQEVYDRLEFWRAFINKPERSKPVFPTLQERKAWTTEQRHEFQEARLNYHAEFGPIAVSAMQNIHESLLAQIDLNLRGGTGARQGGVIDGRPTLGKTTILVHLGRKFELEFRRKHPPKDPRLADLVIPVVYVTLEKKSTPKKLDLAIANFYGIITNKNTKNVDPAWLNRAIVDHARRHRTYLFLIDDIHMLGRKENDTDVNDHLKTLASKIPATFVFAGINCEKSALFSESTNDDSNSQLGGRMVTYPVLPFTQKSPSWQRLLKSFEDNLVLAKYKPGTLLSPEISKYLYERTQGAFGPLSNLIRNAANKAIKNKKEDIDLALLKKTKTTRNAERNSWSLNVEDEEGDIDK